MTVQLYGRTHNTVRRASLLFTCTSQKVKKFFAQFTDACAGFLKLVWNAIRPIWLSNSIANVFLFLSNLISCKAKRMPISSASGTVCLVSGPR